MRTRPRPTTRRERCGLPVAGSVLDLSHVTSITGGTNWNSDLTIEAVAGGRIDLAGVQQIADARSGDLRYGRMSVTADGTGSRGRPLGAGHFPGLRHVGAFSLGGARRRHGAGGIFGRRAGRGTRPGRDRHAADRTTHLSDRRSGDAQRPELCVPRTPERRGDGLHDQRGARGPQRRDQLDARRGDSLERRDGRSEPAPGHRRGQLLGQRWGDAGPAGGAQLCARGDRQRPDADAAGLRCGQRLGPVARHQHHGRHELELGPDRSRPWPAATSISEGCGRSRMRGAEI